MHVLIVTRMNKSDQERGAEADVVRTLRSRAESGVKVTRDEELDWTQLRQTEGSYNAAYRWAARHFDRFVLIEANGGVIAKGQTTIAEYAMQEDRPVVVWRDGRGYRVTGLERISGGDWGRNYARPVVG